MTQSACKTQSNPVEVEIGHMIRMLRLIRGLSQQDLARRLGVSFQQVQKYERAMTHIASSRLYEIATVLRAPIGIFFSSLSSDQTPRGAICDTVERYKDLSPRFGLHEFMELNRAVVGITDDEIRDAVLELVNETASTLGNASSGERREERQGFRPSFRHGSGYGAAHGEYRRWHQTTENAAGGGAVPPDGDEAVTEVESANG